MEAHEIKDKILSTDYVLIAKKLNGRYAVHTIQAQLLGYRTLKDSVREAAELLIKMREEYLTA